MIEIKIKEFELKIPCNLKGFHLAKDFLESIGMYLIQIKSIEEPEEKDEYIRLVDFLLADIRHLNKKLRKRRKRWRELKQFIEDEMIRRFPSTRYMKLRMGIITIIKDKMEELEST